MGRGRIISLAGTVLVGCSLTNLDGFSGGTGSGGIDSGWVSPADADAGAGVDANTDTSTTHPDAPISFVQANAWDFGGSSSVKVSLKRVEPKSAVVIVVEYDSTTATASISDGTSTPYVPVVGPADVKYYDSRSYIFAGFDVAGGDMTFSVSLNGGGNSYLLVYAHEYRGVTAFDVGSWAQGTNKDVDGMSTSLTTSSANELLFAYGFSNRVAVGTGFTARSNDSGNLTQERFVPSPGLVRATATAASGNAWKLLAAAFR
jgi:hypothetical protein